MVYSIILSEVNDNGTTCSFLGVVSEDNLEDVKKQFPRILMDAFLNCYEEEELKDLTFEDSTYGVRAYFNDGYDEKEIYAYGSEIDDISYKNWKTII